MATTNAYATLTQLRSHLGYQHDAIGDDAQLELALNAASRQIDGYCGRRFWQDSTLQVREFEAEEWDELEVPVGISTTTGLVVKVDYADNGTFGTTLTLGTDFLLEPRNATAETPVWPYCELEIITSSSNYFPRSAYNRNLVQITAKFGWPAVPDDVTQACLIQAAQLAEAKLAVFGAVALGDSAARSLRASLNPMAAALVSPFQRPPVG